jgi:subtilisin family serine protease
MVANMSIGGPVSTATNNAVNASVAAGVFYAVAAGNENTNACTRSPASAASAYTIGSTTTSDARSSFSNFGTCVDTFAPGSSITSTWNTSNTATNTISGTSMASPHVAGAAAVIRSQNPSFTPAQVRAAMVGNATSGVVGGAGTGSPNLLLFVGGATQPPPGVTVFFDNFETATGWTTNPLGTDTATTGQWERGDPAQTSSGVVLQLGTTVSGTNDLVTGAAAGASAGEFDVDNGTTTIRSPSITLPSTGTLNLSFSWYLAHLNNATTADFFRVSVNGTQVFQQLGAASNRAGAWATASVSLNAFAGQSIQITVSTADAATASLIEAGVDDVRITQN